MYEYSYTTTNLDAADGALAGLLAFSAVTWVITIVIAVLQIIAMWKIFTKAGKPGWAAIVPIYNMVVLYQIVGMNPLFLLVLIGMVIPFVNFIAAIAMFVLNILVSIKLAKAFGQGGGFAVGLIFLPFIFQLILGFGKSEYQGIQE